MDDRGLLERAAQAADGGQRVGRVGGAGVEPRLGPALQQLVHHAAGEHPRSAHHNRTSPYARPANAAASCIFPVAGEGVHVVPTPARTAGDLFLRVLEIDPGLVRLSRDRLGLVHALQRRQHRPVERLRAE